MPVQNFTPLRSLNVQTVPLELLFHEVASEGMTFQLSTKVTGVEKTESGLKVTVEPAAGGEKSVIEADVMLVSIGLAIPIVVTEEDPARNSGTAPRLAERLPPGTPVLRKPTFGLAGTPEILAAVRRTERSTTVVVGCETDVCVAQSAVGLQEHGLDCVVVADATFSPGEMHERGLDRMASAGIASNHAKGVTYEWLRSVEDARSVGYRPCKVCRPAA